MIANFFTDFCSLLFRYLLLRYLRIALLQSNFIQFLYCEACSSSSRSNPDSYQYNAYADSRNAAPLPRSHCQAVSLHKPEVPESSLSLSGAFHPQLPYEEAALQYNSHSFYSSMASQDLHSDTVC